MPVLPITDGAGNLLPTAGIVITATLCHPKNEKHRREYIAMRFATDLLDGRDKDGEVTVLAATLGVLLDAPSRAQVEELAIGSGRSGGTAGDLLQRVLKYKSFCPQHASLSKAVWVEENTTRINYRGEKLPGSRAEIMGAWGRFKSVAHLWAALRGGQGEGGEVTTAIDLDRPESIPTFLAAAECFRTAGEAITVPGQEKPLLDPDAIWKIPGDLKLRSDIVLLAAPPNADELQLLERYRAPKRI